MKTTYYKVVSVERKNKKVIRRSFIHYRLKGQAPENVTIRYPLGKPARPQVEGTKLMVFGSKEVAIRFWDAEPHLQIWECEVTNPTQVYHVCRFDELSQIAPNGLQEMWDDIMKYDKCDADWYTLRQKVQSDLLGSRHYLAQSFGCAPGQTFACDTVTLTKRVK